MATCIWLHFKHFMDQLTAVSPVFGGGCLYWLFYACPIIVCCLCGEHIICLSFTCHQFERNCIWSDLHKVQELKNFSWSWTLFTWDLELWWSDVAMVEGLGAFEGRCCYIFCVREKWTLLVRRQTDCTIISPLPYALLTMCFDIFSFHWELRSMFSSF